MKKYIATAALVMASALTGKAANYAVTLFDDTFTAKNGTIDITGATPDYEVLWGTFAGGVFTPIGGAAHTTDNDGYLGNPFGSLEISAYAALPNNTALAAGTQLYLAITAIPDGNDYASSSTEAILTDPTWLAPTFDAFAASSLDLTFTAQTTAVSGKGTFSYNGGNEAINLVGVPEPSSYAALAGIMVLGAVATRRRRSA